ncbi:MAG: response regulator transcription factor [Ruminococcaceae bacterium]|nr:response regulator transcription factor [Oscillospiraceae bacterium]
MGNELILVADGDERNLNLVSVTLKAHDYRCITTKMGESALVLANSNNPDVIILDVVLPDMDGTEVIKTIRSWSDAPILVISARSEDHDKVMALDAGADDYIVKPFSVEELLARIRAVKRRFNRYAEHQTDTVFTNGALTVDYAVGCVLVAEREVHLTPIEYKVLCLLSQNVGRVLSYSVITQKIWGSSFSSQVMTLRTFMTTLRKKLSAFSGGENYIVTQTGVGYKMVKMQDVEVE